MAGDKMVKYALAYAAQGWPVIPLHTPVVGKDKEGKPTVVCSCGKAADCDSIGKHPRVRHGLEEATTDEGQVRAWWKRWPDANIGVVTGPESGLWVLDVDGEEGVASLKALQEEKGKLPRTLTQKTGGGGYHLLFAYPLDKDGQPLELHNRVGFRPKLDIRAEGGYVVVAPSMHRTGKRYEWLKGREPGSGTGLAAVPEWLIEESKRRKTKGAISGDSTSVKEIDPKRVLAGVPKGKRDETLFRYACSLRERGVPQKEAVALVLLAAANCDPPFPETQAVEKVKSAWRYKRGPAEEDDRPRLELLPGHDKENALAAAQLMLKIKYPIFLRDKTLVRIYQLPQEVKVIRGSLTRPAGSVTLEPVEPIWLASEIESLFHVVRMDMRKGVFVDARFPVNLARVMIAHRDVAGWRPLDAVVHTPLLLPTGQWIGTPGYHQTPLGGFYLDLPAAGNSTGAGGGWREPDADKIVAEEAVESILSHFKYMAWSDTLSKAAGLSAVITAVMRPLFSSAPMHAIDAPTAGTGKSLFARAISILVTGGEPSTYSWSRDKNENGKWIGAALRSGDVLIVIDNIDTVVDDADLAQILTNDHKAVRVLGESKVEKLPTRIMFLATGNNLIFRGDMTRRVITIRLDAGTEDPELRDIPQDLIQETIEKRQELVWAVQTIMRAWYMDGKKDAGDPPFGLPKLGSFTDWSDVRYALHWLGYPDVVDTIRQAKEADPSRNEIIAVYRNWHRVFHDTPVSTKEVCATMDVDFQTILLSIAGKADKIDTKRLGYWLRAHRDTPVDGLILRRHGSRKKGYQWAVEQTVTLSEAQGVGSQSMLFQENAG